MSHNAIPAAAREAVETALRDPADTRSRAELARAHKVSTRTVSRWADALDIDPAERWSTADTAKATQAATDRRRAARSEIADRLIHEHIPESEELLRRSKTWRKTVILPGPEGATTVEVPEDDAIIARGRKDAKAAINTAMRTALDIDKHDTATEDDGSSATLTKLFDGLAGAYTAITGRQPTDEGEPS